MPRDRKKNLKVKTTKSKLKTSPKNKSSKQKVKEKPVSSLKFYDQLKLSESYMSLILGAVVVVGASVMFLFILKESRKKTVAIPTVLNSSISPQITKIPQKTYVMKENETLWDVAVREYGDGFRYVEIVEANNFENPDFVPPGTKIIIPNSN